MEKLGAMSVACPTTQHGSMWAPVSIDLGGNFEHCNLQVVQASPKDPAVVCSVSNGCSQLSKQATGVGKRCLPRYST